MSSRSEGNKRVRRVQFRFSEEAFRDLEDLAAKEGRTMTEFVRRALTKEKWFLDTAQAGHKIYVEKMEGGMHEIIPQ